jgi:signal transduction histidine kinase
LDVCANPPGWPLPGRVRHQVFFIAKEALNNVLKHSGATEVHLRFAVRGPLFRVVIRDNGCGFNPREGKSTRHGLGNMKQRAVESGMRCVIRSAPGKGTVVALGLRLPRAAG